MTDRARRCGLLIVSLLLCAGCPSDGGSDECADGSVLEAGECIVTCSADTDCTDGQLCIADRCTDAVRPSIVSTKPIADAVDVAPDEAIEIVFSHAMDKTSTGVAFSLSLGDQTVQGSTSWTADGMTSTFTPAASLTHGAVYTLRVGSGALSMEGASLVQPLELSFTVVAEAIGVTSHVPEDGAVEIGLLPLMSFGLSQVAILVEDAAVVTLRAVDDDTDVEVHAYLSLSEDTLYCTPAAPLNAGASYVLTVHAGTLSGLEGASLAEDAVVSFSTVQTSDTEVPLVTIQPFESPPTVESLGESGVLAFGGTATDADSGRAWVGIQLRPRGEAPDVRWLPVTTDSDAWTYDWLPLALDLELLPNGPMTVHARAVDLAGNQSTESMDFDLDLRPPAIPVPAVAISETWKFRTLEVDLQVEPLVVLEVDWNGAPIEGSPIAVDDTGEVGLALAMGATGEVSTLGVVAVDASGNRSEPLEGSIERVPYSCLSATNGFPLVGADVVEGALVDDEEGGVVVTYSLDPDVADDANLSSIIATANYGIDTFVAASNGPDFRMLFRFDEALLVPCAEIQSATLILSGPAPCATCVPPDDLTAYPVARLWEERQTTWELAQTNETWAGPGLTVGDDYLDEPVGSFVFDEVSGAAALDVTAISKRWQATASEDVAQDNFGLVMFPLSPGSATFYSTEYGDASLRPQLELNLVEQP